MSFKKKLLKNKAISYMGGCCQICGYNKCEAALHFHHLNPHEKDFTISSKSNWEDIVDELDKCILLCANCHISYHNGLISLDTIIALAELD